MEDLCFYFQNVRGVEIIPEQLQHTDPKLKCIKIEHTAKQNGTLDEKGL